MIFKDDQETLAQINQSIKDIFQNFIKNKDEFSSYAFKNDIFKDCFDTLLHIVINHHSIFKKNQNLSLSIEENLNDIENVFAKEFDGMDFSSIIRDMDTLKVRKYSQYIINNLLKLNLLKNKDLNYFPKFDNFYGQDFLLFKIDFHLMNEIFSTPEIENFIKDKKYIKDFLFCYYKTGIRSSSHNLEFLLSRTRDLFSDTFFSMENLVWIFNNTKHPHSDTIKKIVVNEMYRRIKPTCVSDKQSEKWTIKKIKNLFNSLKPSNKDSQKECIDMLNVLSNHEKNFIPYCLLNLLVASLGLFFCVLYDFLVDLLFQESEPPEWLLITVIIAIFTVAIICFFGDLISEHQKYIEIKHFKDVRDLFEVSDNNLIINDAKIEEVIQNKKHPS